MKKEIRRVHVVFKTHLDIGFTDMAAQVINTYMNTYIPKAMDLAEELERSGGQAQFVWTTGSWLIDEYLRCGDTDHERMVRAIQKGQIAWHGMPFTTHTELLDSSLLQYGLSIASRLDVRFGKQTIAAKMTDVPGHTIGMVNDLAACGIRYLHLGVNPASRVPEVPAIFRWRTASGQEVIINYAQDYGGEADAAGIGEVLVFAHTGDNLGPPEAAKVRELFASLEQQYPGAEIKASTMDEYAAALLKRSSDLPVVEEEIGDTWIHGVGSDPWKLAAYRALCRLRSAWLASGAMVEDSEAHRRFSNGLLLVAEHTWGLDTKLHLADYRNYDRPRFEAARCSAAPEPYVTPAKYRHFTPFVMLHEYPSAQSAGNTAVQEGSWRQMEASWQEQRSYLAEALSVLPERLRIEAEVELAALEPPVKLPEGAEPLEPGVGYPFGGFLVRFDREGAIESLEDLYGQTWAQPEKRLGVISYETFGAECYERWHREYMRNREATHSWSEADFGKPGLEFAKPPAEHAIHRPHLVRLSAVRESGTTRVYAQVVMPEGAVRDNGAPAAFMLEYSFPPQELRVGLTVHWTNKAANRKPEAVWLSMNPVVACPQRWRMHKTGSWLSPLSVVRGGNRALHAVQEGVRYTGYDGTMLIRTLDAALAAPGAGSLLRSDDRFHELEGGWHFLLYNNVWGTNFPMWYEGNAQFRFILEFD